VPRCVLDLGTSFSPHSSPRLTSASLGPGRQRDAERTGLHAGKPETARGRVQEMSVTALRFGIQTGIVGLRPILFRALTHQHGEHAGQ